MQTKSDRLLKRIDQLAALSQTRLALTAEDKLGRDQLCSWMREADLRVEIDQIGNIFAFRKGKSGQSVIIGSHIDTVRNGGKYDGILGVLAGLEIAESLNENHIETEKTLIVASFTNEEGARYTPDMMGSLYCAGALDLEQVYQQLSISGQKTFKEELTDISYLGSFHLDTNSIEAFLELHIEQGPVLEHEKLEIGIVEGVQGIYWAAIEIEGTANHAGTTPMNLRNDAFNTALEFLTQLKSSLLSIPDQLVTVGRFEISPNVINVVPARVQFSIDLRNHKRENLQDAINLFKNSCDQLIQSGIQISKKELVHFDPVQFDADLLSDLENCVKGKRLSYKRMISGAGHDAQMMARIAPSVMLFIPSKNGISHNPAEFSSKQQIENGLNVLTELSLKKLIIRDRDI